MNNNNNGLKRYLLFAFLVPYLLWGMVFLAQELGWFQYGESFSVVLVAIAANCPAVAAFLALRQEQPGYSLKSFAKSAFGVRQKPLYYALLALFVFLFFAVPALMGGIAAQVSPFSGGTEAAERYPIWMTLLISPFFFFLGGSEEIGWRHYLQPAFEKKLSFIPATLLTSFVWVIWHLPLFLIVGTSQNSSNLLSFTIYAIGASFAMAAIRRITKSTWLCVMFHCMTNAMQGSLPLLDDLLIKIVGCVALVAAALVAVAFHTIWSRQQVTSQERRTI